MPMPRVPPRFAQERLESRPGQLRTLFESARGTWSSSTVSIVRVAVGGPGRMVNGEGTQRCATQGDREGDDHDR
jgi:hypothetical protein